MEFATIFKSSRAFVRLFIYYYFFLVYKRRWQTSLKLATPLQTLLLFRFKQTRKDRKDSFSSFLHLPHSLPPFFSFLNEHLTLLLSSKCHIERRKKYFANIFFYCLHILYTPRGIEQKKSVIFLYFQFSLRASLLSGSINLGDVIRLENLTRNFYFA